MKNKILNVILVLLCIVFVVSAFMVVRTLYLSNKHTKNFEKISSLAPLPPKSEQDTEAKEQVVTFFDTLYSQNGDIGAYLKIPDTQIDYPVMYTPTEEEFYLRRDFTKKYSYYGTPFFETECAADGGVNIIYGHHISGKKMFGELLYYRTQDFFDAHSEVHLYHKDGDSIYTVFAAFYTTGDDKHGIYTRGANGLYTKEEFDNYINDIKSIATTKNDDIDIEIGDEILLMSTCEYSQHVGRFVVAAVKKK